MLEGTRDHQVQLQWYNSQCVVTPEHKEYILLSHFLSTDVESCIWGVVFVEKQVLCAAMQMATSCSWGSHAVIGTETMESKAWCHVWIQERLGWAEHRVILEFCLVLFSCMQTREQLCFIQVNPCANSKCRCLCLVRYFSQEVSCASPLLMDFEVKSVHWYSFSSQLQSGMRAVAGTEIKFCARDCFLHTLKTCIRLCFPVQEWEYYKITPSVDLLSCNKAGWCLITLLPFFLFLLQLLLLLVVNSNA